MPIINCDICGDPFVSPHCMKKLCPYCKMNEGRSVYREEQRRPKQNPNNKLADQVREATKLGVSYGEYQRLKYQGVKR